MSWLLSILLAILLAYWITTLLLEIPTLLYHLAFSPTFVKPTDGSFPSQDVMIGSFSGPSFCQHNPLRLYFGGVVQADYKKGWQTLLKRRVAQEAEK